MGLGLRRKKPATAGENTLPGAPTEAMDLSPGAGSAPALAVLSVEVRGSRTHWFSRKGASEIVRKYNIFEMPLLGPLLRPQPPSCLDPAVEGLTPLHLQPVKEMSSQEGTLGRVRHQQDAFGQGRCELGAQGCAFCMPRFGAAYRAVYDYSCAPNNVSTLWGSYGSCKGWCFIRVLQLGRGIFPVNFRIVWLLPNVRLHFDSACSHKRCVRVLGSIWAAAFSLWISREACTRCVLWAQPGPRHFFNKFPYKVAPVTCWLACRLQARTKRVSAFWAESGPRHFSSKLQYKAAFVKCPLPFRLRELAQNVCLRSGLNQGCRILPVNFPRKWFLSIVRVSFN